MHKITATNSHKHTYANIYDTPIGRETYTKKYTDKQRNIERNKLTYTYEQNT